MRFVSFWFSRSLPRVRFFNHKQLDKTDDFFFGCGEFTYFRPFLSSSRCVFCEKCEKYTFKISPRAAQIQARLLRVENQQLWSAIAAVCSSCACNSSPPLKSVLSREKTLHRNARNSSGEVYDAATSSVINKKCLNSYVNFASFEFTFSTFRRAHFPLV